MTFSSYSSEQWQCKKTLPECLGYLLDNEVSCDIKFLCGKAKTPVQAHKTLLISRSPVFHAMLDGPMKEKNSAIDLPDIEPDTFRLFLRYVYTDMVDLSTDNVIPVLYVAKKYCLEMLSKRCTNFLKSSVSDENACLLFEQSHIYDEKDLHEKCFKHIISHPQKVLQSESFQYLCSTCCDSIISSDKLAVKEEVVYEAVLGWSDAECKRRHLGVTGLNRRKVLGGLFERIRFPLIEKEYFAKHILKQDLLSDKEKLAVVEIHYNMSDDKESDINKHRISRLTSAERILRFGRTRTAGTSGWWKYSGTADSICFKITDDVVLHGVVLYGNCDSSVYKVKVEIINDEDKVLSAVNTQYTAASSSPYSYDLILDSPMFINKDRNYEVKAVIAGPVSCFGESGQKTVDFNTAKIVFSDAQSSRNGTKSNRGQIPGLLISSV